MGGREPLLCSVNRRDNVVNWNCCLLTFSSGGEASSLDLRFFFRLGGWDSRSEPLGDALQSVISAATNKKCVCVGGNQPGNLGPNWTWRELSIVKAVTKDTVTEISLWVVGCFSVGKTE